jgi:hypothetical protein
MSRGIEEFQTVALMEWRNHDPLKDYNPTVLLCDSYIDMVDMGISELFGETGKIRPIALGKSNSEHFVPGIIMRCERLTYSAHDDKKRIVEYGRRALVHYAVQKFSNIDLRYFTEQSLSSEVQVFLTGKPDEYERRWLDGQTEPPLKRVMTQMKKVIDMQSSPEFAEHVKTLTTHIHELGDLCKELVKPKK